MQLINILTITVVLCTSLVAAIPGVVEMRAPDVDLDELLLPRGTKHCANVAKIKRPNKYEKEG